VISNLFAPGTEKKSWVRITQFSGKDPEEKSQKPTGHISLNSWRTGGGGSRKAQEHEGRGNM